MITYITVHGTGDGERADEGGERQWWRADSDFSTELLSKSPSGSRIEPFLWSGANDEMARRSAAENLLDRLRAADEAGDRVHLVGHSHGGSVIALALRFAAADGRRLSSLAGFTTIGTPFLGLKLDISPWGRFGSLGKALFTFLIPAAILLIMMLIGVLLELPKLIEAGTNPFSGFGMFLFMPYLFGSGIIVLVCLLTLIWLRRSRRGLFGKRAMRRIERRFRAQWLGLYSRHDEAIAGLTAAAGLNARVFDRTVLRAPLAYTALIIFLFPIIAVWGVFIVGSFFTSFESSERFETIRTLYSDSFFGEPHALAHFWLGSWLQPILQAHLELLSTLRNFWFSSTMGGLFETPSYNNSTAWFLASIGFPLSLLASYVILLTVWLWLVDQFAVRVAGPIAARVVNGSIRTALLDRAYGSHTVAESALNASNSPFAAAQARVIPEEIDRALFDHALAGAGDTFRKMREEIFAADRAGAFDPINSALKHLTWSELVHTCYFRVAPARAYLAATVAEHAVTCAQHAPHANPARSGQQAAASSAAAL